MGLNVVTPPTVEPVSMLRAMKHLRVDDGDADTSYIDDLIRVARVYCEGRQSRAYMTQTLELSLDAFPIERYIELPKPPLQSVESITYTDETGTTSTFDKANYAVDSKSLIGKVVLMPGKSWPIFKPYPVNAVTIRYVAGATDTTLVDNRVAQAMLLLIGHWHENREAVITGTVSKELEFAVSSLLNANAIQ